MIAAQTSASTHLAGGGVSIWLDDLSRELLDTGELEALVARNDVVGVTTNPTIFANAVSRGARRYASQIRGLSAQGAGIDEIAFEITAADVRRACDLLDRIYRSSEGYDGRVSIEIEPRLAHDAEATVARARTLRDAIGRDNVMIKIPATQAGLWAIENSIAVGISVNVTLIFSRERYGEVVEAYLRGLERAHAAGLDLSTIHSVASFFISRVDAHVETRLRAGGTVVTGLRAAVATANARLAYEDSVRLFASRRAQRMLAEGAHPQRLLWASTGTKDPSLDALHYVRSLLLPHTVHTVPRETLQILGALAAPVLATDVDVSDAAGILRLAEAHGTDIKETAASLEREGIDKFTRSWDEMLATIAAVTPGAARSRPLLVDGRPAQEMNRTVRPLGTTSKKGNHHDR